MKKYLEYFNYIQKLLQEVFTEEKDSLEKAISLITEKIKNNEIFLSESIS